MTIHNEIAYYTSLLAGFRRAIGIQGDGVERLGETLTPVVDLWSQPEWALLRGERLFMDAQTSAAVAGELSMVALLVPTTVSILAVVERVIIEANAAAQGHLALATAAQITATLALSGTGQGDSRDRRGRALAVSGSQALQYTGSDAASVGNVAQIRRQSAAGSMEFITPIVLSPGEGIIATLALANTACNVSLVWRERQMLPGENRIV